MYKILLHRYRTVFVNGPVVKCTTIRLNEKEKKKVWNSINVENDMPFKN